MSAEDNRIPTQEDHKLIRETVLLSLIEAEKRGADKRHYRTALWHSAISTILSVADTPIVIAVLEDQAASIKGYGTNADSPIREYSEDDLSTRKRHSSIIVPIIDSFSTPIIDKIDEQGRDGISAFLIAVFNVLKDWWGPVHLRRIISDQVKFLKDGGETVIAPSEPAWSNKRKNIDIGKPAILPSHPRTVRIYATCSKNSLRYSVGFNLTTLAGLKKETRNVSGGGSSERDVYIQMTETVLSMLENLNPPHPEDKIALVSDVGDPTVSDHIPVILSEKFSAVMRDHQTGWTRVLDLKNA